MSEQSIKVLENSLLIADPSLQDGCFDRAVIHISEHNPKEGALGYILNKPTDKKVGEVLKEPMFQSLSSIPVFFGGPVDTDQIVFSAYWWDDQENFRYRLRISAEEASQMKRWPGSLLIAHVGHSAWHEGQLESELLEQAWVSRSVANSTLAIAPSQMWHELLQDITPYHRLLSLTPLRMGMN